MLLTESHKHLKELIRQAKKELNQPVYLPDNAKQIILNRYGTLTEANKHIDIPYRTMWSHLNQGFIPPKYTKMYSKLFAYDLHSQATT